eukprot:1181322-Prorocentrum_minimum.AAC.2
MASVKNWREIGILSRGTRWLDKVLMVDSKVSVSSPTVRFPVSDWSVMRIYPCFLRLIGRFYSVRVELYSQKGPLRKVRRRPSRAYPTLDEKNNSRARRSYVRRPFR